MDNNTVILSSSLLASVYLTYKTLKILNKYKHDPLLTIMNGLAFNLSCTLSTYFFLFAIHKL
jgi:MinD-like ATPase involved in chromosome partitioning or flagellar assembly